jgi:hypothetical protein
MPLKLFARIVFMTVYLPAYVLRKVRGGSPFGAGAHLASSAWDR